MILEPFRIRRAGRQGATAGWTILSRAWFAQNLTDHVARTDFGTG
ncbi:hypothetical protein ACLQ2R_21995 [Streptosporangium sp. DT93]